MLDCTAFWKHFSEVRLFLATAQNHNGRVIGNAGILFYFFVSVRLQIKKLWSFEYRSATNTASCPLTLSIIACGGISIYPFYGRISRKHEIHIMIHWWRDYWTRDGESVTGGKAVGDPQTLRRLESARRRHRGKMGAKAWQKRKYGWITMHVVTQGMLPRRGYIGYPNHWYQLSGPSVITLIHPASPSIPSLDSYGACPSATAPLWCRHHANFPVFGRFGCWNPDKMYTETRLSSGDSAWFRNESNKMPDSNTDMKPNFYLIVASRARPSIILPSNAAQQYIHVFLLFVTIVHHRRRQGVILLVVQVA